MTKYGMIQELKRKGRYSEARKLEESDSDDFSEFNSLLGLAVDVATISVIDNLFDSNSGGSSSDFSGGGGDFGGGGSGGDY